MRKARPINLLSLALLCLAALGVLASVPARADSWMDPEPFTTPSAAGTYRFTVTPSPVDSALDYFTEEIAAQEEGRKVERPAPVGLLERRTASGGWEPVWAAPLVNDIAPTQALVADDGRYVVTFNNWYSVGHGENVIVIYRADGSLVRSMALTDLIPQMVKDSLSHSVSSVTWKKAEGILPDGEHLFIDVLVPGEKPYSDDAASVRFTIALASGAVTLPDEAAWSAVMAKASALTLERIREEMAWLDMMRNPLLPPAGCDAWEWEQYLREAVQRLMPEQEDVRFPPGYVLDRSGSLRARNALSFFGGDLTNRFGVAQEVAVAAPCLDGELERQVGKIVRKVKRGSLKSSSVYVSASRATFDTVAALLAPSGAKVVWLDPAQPIPQLAHRIPGSDEKRAADDAYQARLRAEMEAEAAIPSS